MEININQQKLTIGDKYRIYTDNRETHFAATRLFKILSEVHLYKTGETLPVIVMKKRWAWLKTTYDLIMPDNKILEFRTISWWRHHFTCNAGHTNYHVYAHKGRKVSVYKEDKQIAWWDKKAVSWFEGDNYKIIADADADAELLIALCIVIDNAAHKNNGNNMLTIDIGKIGPQAKKFDKDWQPAI